MLGEYTDDSADQFTEQMNELDMDEDIFSTDQAILNTKMEELIETSKTMDVFNINLDIDDTGPKANITTKDTIEVPNSYPSPVFIQNGTSNVKQEVIEETSMHERAHNAIPDKWDYAKLSPYFAYPPRHTIQHTLCNTTQLAKAIIRFPLCRHSKSRFQMLRAPRLNEVVATDTYFASTKSIEGYTCGQVYYGCSSRIIEFYGMKTESEFINTYQDFMHEEAYHTHYAETMQKVKNQQLLLNYTVI